MRGGAILLLAVLVAAWAAVAVVASPQAPVQLRVLRLVDHSRRAHFRNRTSGPRVLVTYVPSPTRGHAPLPLIVFAHGFALTPQIYARLLDTCTRAGDVVAAPLFPVQT